MNLKELLQDKTLVSASAWVVVDNQSDSGIRFIEGPQSLATASGLSAVMPGMERIFQIDMPRNSINHSYAESVTKDNWRFGPIGFEVPLQTDEDDSTPLGPLTVEQNKMYTVTVTGNPYVVTLKAWISSIDVIPVSDIGSW
jgi:hypothetical protein